MCQLLGSNNKEGRASYRSIHKIDTALLSFRRIRYFVGIKADQAFHFVIINHHYRPTIMGRKKSTSKSTIKSDKSSSGISLCYIILLSLFAASEGKNWGGRRSYGFFSSLLPRSSCTNRIFSKNTNEVSYNNELAIVPCHEKITSLRGGALNPFPAGCKLSMHVVFFTYHMTFELTTTHNHLPIIPFFIL